MRNSGSFASIAVAVGLAASSAFALPRFTGTVEDRNGPVDGATVALWFYETGTGRQGTTVAGRFLIAPMKEGDYFFRVEKDGQTPAYGAVHLFGDGDHPVKIYLRPKDKGEEVGADLPPADAAPDAPQRIDPKAGGLKVVKSTAPQYPTTDKERRFQGDVMIDVLIRIDGTLDDLVVLSSPDRDMALSSLAAVRHWKYRPVKTNGIPAEAFTNVTVHYRIE